MGAGAPPGPLMTSAAQVREKLIGRTVRQPGNTGRLALLQTGGKGQVWGTGTLARAEAVDWSIKNGTQVGMNAPAELWFLCVTYPPSEGRPRGGEQCTQADLWTIAEGERPPA